METTILITPIHKNGYTAPSIAVTVKKDDNSYVNAKKEAMKLSRLSDFPEWKFV